MSGLELIQGSCADQNVDAVGPDFSYTPNAFKQLYDAYYNSFKVLVENGLTSISLPLISSGIYGGSLDNPVKESCEKCIQAYNNFTQEHKDKNILDDKGVNKQPGVGDITKQYLYELAYKDFAKENNLVIDSNAFLMPIDGKEEKKVGTASMDIFYGLGDIRLHDIDVILKPSEEMYKAYLEL